MAPGSAGTLVGGLTKAPTEEVSAMADVINDERRRIAGEYLTRARDMLEVAERDRERYVLLARQYGMSDASIAALLGVSETDVVVLAARRSSAA